MFLFDQKQSIYSQEPKWVDDLRNIFYLIFFGIFYGLFALLVAGVIMNNYLLILSACLAFLNASLASIKIWHILVFFIILGLFNQK